MKQVENGDTVKVHYTGKLGDGTVFDSSANREPLQFKVGENQVISGFEKAVVGMTPGESKTAEIQADEAFGQHQEGMVIEVAKERFPEGLVPVINQRLKLSQADGQTHTVTVTDVTESSVTLDANHPLAGKDLVLDIQLVEIC
jgi:peptidylprolyl isomerase